MRTSDAERNDTPGNPNSESQAERNDTPTLTPNTNPNSEPPPGGGVSQRKVGLLFFFITLTPRVE